MDVTNNIIKTYNDISKEFNETRYTVWREVKCFLDSLDSKTSLCEVGCGNGKNLLYRKDLLSKGYDLSDKLVEICKNKNLDVEVGNILELNVKDNTFDNTICIAVIHHLENRSDRIKAIQELLRITKKNGKILIYVWAYEYSTEKKSKRHFIKGANIVPFNGKNRFYYIYSKDELENEIKEVKNMNFSIDSIYYDLGNWYAILTKN